MTPDDVPPPNHIGNYPHGAYWSAERRPGAQESDDAVDYTVDGPVLRFMWDYGVRVPLWDAAGLLPERADWLREALGLSDALIVDLARWGRQMDELDGAPGRRTKDAYEALDERARRLAERLQGEVGARFTVVYHPW